MSVERCEKHDMRYDTDFQLECPRCVGADKWIGEPSVFFTPTPWSAHKYPDCKTWTIAADISIASKLTAANAAYIVQCVNSHEILVKALEEVVALELFTPNNLQAALTIIQLTIDQAQAALAKVRT